MRRGAHRERQIRARLKRRFGMKITAEGNVKENMKRLLVSVLVAMMMVSLLPAGAPSVAKAADTSADAQSSSPAKRIVKPRLKKRITVTGLDQEKNEYSRKRAQDAVRVTGANGRKAELQKRKNGKWVTVRSYAIKGKKNAKVVLKYPSRSKTYTYWRLHIDGDSSTMAYNSTPCP